MPSDTAQRLTDAVLLAMREHGYAGTSMQDLLRSSGVSSSSMYHFFPGGKEELVASAVRRSGLVSAEQIGDVLRTRGLVPGLLAIFAAAEAEMEGHGFSLGCPIGVPATEIPSESEAIRDAVADVFAAWADAYAAALRANGFDDESAAALGRSIVALYEGTVTLARASRSTEPYRDAASLVTALLDR